MPQARQPHAFLGRSVRVLGQETPDVLDDLLRRGALRVPTDLGDGGDDASVCCRRLVYEAVLRDAAERQPGITIRDAEVVGDLVVEAGSPPVVRGVQLGSGETVSADLVVDAAGRRSPVPGLLIRRGLRPLPEMGQECGFIYTSRHYRLRPGTEFRPLRNIGTKSHAKDASAPRG